MPSAPEHIFHIALTRDWEAALLLGEYRVSTLGATLDDVGFIHGSFREQVERIGSFLYVAVSEPVTVLDIDTQRLNAPRSGGEPRRRTGAFPPYLRTTPRFRGGRNDAGENRCRKISRGLGFCPVRVALLGCPSRWTTSLRNFGRVSPNTDHLERRPAFLSAGRVARRA